MSELLLNDCLRADLKAFAPLVCKMNHLKILHLHDNRNLTGLLENIRFASFPLLEQLALQRTNVATRRGLTMLLFCPRLTYIDVTGCKSITGDIPASILSTPGLLLNVKSSGLEEADTIGNDSRLKRRWGKKDAAKRPGAP